MIIGTAGHIDHGKTALVKVLTGIDADRLAEEKRRGITIDLGFAYWDRFGFVDVPGHERFVHTMLAGATGIDAALFVVALDDGVMPQTREHLAILDLLGIDRGVVALTKADVARNNIDAVTTEVRALLSGTGLRDAVIIPVSAMTGEGIAELTAALQMLGSRQHDLEGYPRLAVDRAFTLAGAGLVVTGTLAAGRIAVDDRLVLSPPGLELRVRGLHAQNRRTDKAEAGQRVGLNVTGPRLSKEVVSRGNWVVHADIHTPTGSLDTRLHLLADAPAPLRSATPVHLHLAAEHVMARVHVLDGDRVAPGTDAWVRLTLDRPIGALAEDRLVLRDSRASQTVGGGRVIDPFPPARGRRTGARLAQLAALQSAAPQDALRQLLSLSPGWTDRERFRRARNLPPARAARVEQAAPAVAIADLLMSPPTLEALQHSIAQTLAACHAAAPDQPGLQPERLRQALSPRPSSAAFRAILDLMLRRSIMRQDGPWLRLSTHQIRLSPADERLWPEIHARITAERFRPPRTRDLARELAIPEGALRGALKRLQRVGRLLELAPDHFFLRETVAEMAGIAAELARNDAQGQLTAAAFRDRLNNGRKVAIQVLEFFDRVGLTIRSRDARIVRADRLSMFGGTEKVADDRVDVAEVTR